MIAVTFNVRREFEDDLENRFENRKELIKTTIEKNQPDVIGFQEVLPDALGWLKSALSDYVVVGCGRDDDLGDEATAIAFRREKYDLIQMNTFWLSPSPHVPGSRYEDQSECPRTCTVTLLSDISEGKVFRIYNTHLDHIGTKARLHGVKQIVKRTSEEKLFPNAPFIIMGDFNALPADLEVKYLEDVAELCDFTKVIEGSFHDFGQLNNPEKIDYIFGSGHWILKNVGVWGSDTKDGYISDHFPVFVEISTK